MNFIDELGSKLVIEEQVRDLSNKSSLSEFDFIGIKESLTAINLIAFVKADNLTYEEIIGRREKFFDITRNIGSILGIRTLLRNPNGLLCFVFENGCPRAVYDRLSEIIEEQNQISHSINGGLVFSWLIDLKGKIISAHKELMSKFPPVYLSKNLTFPTLYYLENFIADYTPKNEFKDNDMDKINNRKKVFIVHGQDEAAKESLARFLSRLDLNPIILHEQTSGGKTIIEKFEYHSNEVSYAVVLLTPDDVGNIKTESDNLRPRARQNVIFELGYFFGKLGRNKVCALYKEGVDLPSDMHGVIYVLMDSAGAWKIKLAQEIKQTGLEVDMNKI